MESVDQTESSQRIKSPASAKMQCRAVFQLSVVILQNMVLDSSLPFVEFPIRVRYFETDQMGVVHHAHYFVWFEAARSEFCRKHGVDYRQMEAGGLFMPVVQ